MLGSRREVLGKERRTTNQEFGLVDRVTREESDAIPLGKAHLILLELLLFHLVGHSLDADVALYQARPLHFMPIRTFRWSLFAFCEGGLAAFHLAVLGLESSLILHKNEIWAIQGFNGQLQGTGIQQLVSPGTTSVLEDVGIQFPLAVMTGIVLAVMLVVRIAAAKVPVGLGQEWVLELTHTLHAAGDGGGVILWEQRELEDVTSAKQGSRKASHPH